MKRLLLAATAAAVLGSAAWAQNLDNDNDLALYRGLDILYVYGDPSNGVDAGVTAPPWGSATAPWTTNDFYWKVFPREALRDCSGSLEITSFEMFNFDTDYTTLDANGNNTALQDMQITVGVPSVLNPGQIEPSPDDPASIYIVGGRIFLPDPGCPPPGFANGYLLNVNFAGGVPGAGIILTAAGATDYVINHFVPGGYAGPFSAPGTGACLQGDMPIPDAHSSGLFCGATGTCADACGGETQADWLATGYSAYGGFGAPGPTFGGIDFICETPGFAFQFRENIVVPRVDAGMGVGVEEGLAALKMSMSLYPGAKSIGGRLYAYQSVGDFGIVSISLAGNIPNPCVPIVGGGRVGVIPDGFWAATFALLQGPIVLTDNGAAPIGDPFDDGTFDTLNLGPLPPGFGALNLYYQGHAVNLMPPPLTVDSTQVFVCDLLP